MPRADPRVLPQFAKVRQIVDTAVEGNTALRRGFENKKQYVEVPRRRPMIGWGNTRRNVGERVVAPLELSARRQFEIERDGSVRKRRQGGEMDAVVHGRSRHPRQPGERQNAERKRPRKARRFLPLRRPPTRKQAAATRSPGRS